jgi:hypothetical protein
MIRWIRFDHFLLALYFSTYSLCINYSLCFLFLYNNKSSNFLPEKLSCISCQNSGLFKSVPNIFLITEDAY